MEPNSRVATLTQVGLSGYQFKLYIQLPDSPLTSTAVSCRDCGRWSYHHFALEWSPAGTRVLACTRNSFALMAWGCSLVLNTCRYHRSNALFDPFGRFVAAVHSRVTHRCRFLDMPLHELSVNLYSTYDGALAFTQVIATG